MKAMFIFYVADQASTKNFYEKVLALKPTLDVPGMTEFSLPDGSKIGFMPNAGIKQLLGEKLPDPAQAAGIPRAEIYLLVDDPVAYHQRALESGAREIQPFQSMDWGDTVAYSLDPDGHVLAFAKVGE